MIPQTDAEKLRFLADWFDEQDYEHRGGRATLDEVQQDLRRIADVLEGLDERATYPAVTLPPPLTREISDAIVHAFTAATIPSEMTRGLIERGVFSAPRSED